MNSHYRWWLLPPQRPQGECIESRCAHIKTIAKSWHMTLQNEEIK